MEYIIFFVLIVSSFFCFLFSWRIVTETPEWRMDLPYVVCAAVLFVIGLDTLAVAYFINPYMMVLK